MQIDNDHSPPEAFWFRRRKTIMLQSEGLYGWDAEQPFFSCGL